MLVLQPVYACTRLATPNMLTPDSDSESSYTVVSPSSSPTVSKLQMPPTRDDEFYCEDIVFLVSCVLTGSTAEYV